MVWYNWYNAYVANMAKFEPSMCVVNCSARARSCVALHVINNTVYIHALI